MKKRMGFVTNSSSSSFICDVCGDIASGWDYCLSDVYMSECENGHIMCDSHVLDISDEKKDEIFLKEAKIKLDECLKTDCGEHNYKQVSEYLKDNDLTVDTLITKGSEFVLDLFKDTFKWSVGEDGPECLDFNEYISMEEISRYCIPKVTCPLCMHEKVADEEMIDFAVNKLGITKSELREATREALIEKDNIG